MKVPLFEMVVNNYAIKKTDSMSYSSNRFYLKLTTYNSLIFLKSLSIRTAEYLYFYSIPPQFENLI
jgi:hypothetical protein